MITVSGTFTDPSGNPLPFVTIIVKAVQSVPGASAIPVTANVTEQSDATGAYTFDLDNGVYAVSISGGGIAQAVSLGQAVVNDASVNADLITLVGTSGVPTSTIMAAIAEAAAQSAPTIEIGTTTTGQPGTAASVENVGTPTALVLDFMIPQGEQGLPGANASVFSASAGVTISAQTAVALINGVVVPAQNTVLEQFGNVVGVSQNGGVAGTLINIQQSGEISLSSWAWTLNKPVYVGPNGPLTQTAPTSGFLQIVGVPITATSLSIGLQPPIILQ